MLKKKDKGNSKIKWFISTLGTAILVGLILVLCVDALLGEVNPLLSLVIGAVCGLAAALCTCQPMLVEGEPVNESAQLEVVAGELPED